MYRRGILSTLSECIGKNTPFTPTENKKDLVKAKKWLAVDLVKSGQ
jgi:hypothetical protein